MKPTTKTQCRRYSDLLVGEMHPHDAWIPAIFAEVSSILIA